MWGLFLFFGTGGPVYSPMVYWDYSCIFYSHMIGYTYEASEKKFVDTVNRMIRKKIPLTRLQAQCRISGYSQRACRKGWR